MKYNTTYFQEINLKETIKITSNIRDEILNFLKSKFKIISLMAPGYFLEDDEIILKIDEITRGITFDSLKEYKIGHLTLTHSSYLRKMILKLLLNKDEALLSEGVFIWRDLPENPVVTPEKHEMTLQFVIDENVDEEIFVKKTTKDLYDFILSLANQIEKKYNIKNIFPKNVQIITAQNLENEYFDKSPKEREIEAITELDAFLFKSPGAQLLTGNIHTWIPPTIYDLDIFYQILLKDRVNSFVIKVASVAKIITGKKLSSQLTKYGLDDLKSTNLYSSMINDETKIIEIKLNIPRLVMALLGKGHISEVQPGVYSDEKKVINSKYKIETF